MRASDDRVPGVQAERRCSGVALLQEMPLGMYAVEDHREFPARCPATEIAVRLRTCACLRRRGSLLYLVHK